MSRTTYWQRIYERLHKHGYTDQQIAERAGVGRQVICRVRNKSWPWEHDLKSVGAQNIEAMVEETTRQGALPFDPTEDEADEPNKL